MPQHWRCSNGHAWTGDLGALTYCPDCGSADVYEVRPQYESLPSAPATVPAADVSGRTYVQPATVKIGPPAEANVGDTLMQAPVNFANVGDTLTQPAVNVGDTYIQPADAGTTLMQAYVPNDDRTTLIQAPVLENGADASGDMLLQPPRKPKDDSTLEMLIPNADGTIHQPADAPTLPSPQSQAASNETRLFQSPMDGGSAPAFTADTPTLDAPAGVSPRSPIAGYPSTMEVDATPRAKTPGLSGQDTRVAPPSPARGRDSRTGTPPPPPVEGYEILSVLGRGGMGVVYKARQVKLNRIVALKMILAGGHAGAYERQRFMTEANAVAALQHPNIVQIYETGERDGLPYFSLEFCDGGSLQQKLGGQPIPPKIAADVAEQLSRAMQYAHERGIVHRDLKPANILFAGEEAAAREKATSSKDSKISSKDAKTLSKGAHESRDANKDTGPSRTSQSKTLKSHASSRGSSSTASMRASQVMPKVTDFGLAKRLEEDSGLTGSGTILGTPSYMAPEQAAGESRSVGPPADIHALGAILYEMLTGRPPFLGENVVETMNQVRTLDPVPPTRIQPKTPMDLETVCLKCLQKEIHKRYVTAGDLADDLRRFLHGEPIAARPVPVWEKGWKWAKRRPAQAALIAMSVAVLIAAAIGGVSFGRYRGQQAVEEARLKQNALDEYQRAEANFKSAREAVDSLLVRIGAERLEFVPKAEKLRKELLEQSLTFYDLFLKTHGNDPAVQREAGWAYQRVGRVRNDLGDRKEAIAAYNKAAELFGSLTAQSQDQFAEDKFDLAQTQRQLSIVLEANNQPQAADAAYDAARSILRTLADSHSDRPAYRSQLADLLVDRGAQFYKRRKLADSEDAFHQAVAEYERLCQSDPSAVNRFSLARAQDNLGGVILVAGRNEAALAELKKAVASLIALVRDYPDNPEHIKELGQSGYNLGNALFQTGKLDEAKAAYDDSIQRLGKLAADFPRIPDYRFVLAIAHDNLAHYLKVKPGGGLRAAQPERDAAIDLYRQLLAVVPNESDYRKRLALDLDEQAAFLADNDRVDEAIQREKESASIFRALTADNPTDLEITQENAKRHLNLGELYARRHLPDDAEAEYSVSAALFEGLADRRVLGETSWHDLSIVYRNQLLLFKEMGRERAAERCGRAAVAIGRRIVAKQPNDPTAAAGLAEAEAMLAVVATVKPAETIAHLQEAMRWQRSALTQFPKRVDWARALGDYGIALIVRLADQGDHVAAARETAALTSEVSPDWSGWPALANQLARCVRLARSDKSLSDDQKAKISTAYGQQALDFLRKAVAAGYKDADALKQSTDLEVLRTDPQFQSKFDKVLAAIPQKN